jgi:hypothetical protein
MAAAQLPPLPELIPVSDAEALRSPAPTPLLDAALARARHIQEATLREPEPGEKPSPRLVLPDTAPPALASAPAGGGGEPASPAPLDPGVILASAEEIEAAGEPPAAEEPPTPPPLPPEPVPAPEPVGEVKPGAVWDEIVARLDAAAPPVAPGGEAAVEEASELRLAELKLCRKVMGLGEVEELDPTSCRPGQSVIVYCELEGVTYRPSGAEYESALETTVELVRAEDGRAVWSDQKSTSEHCSKPREGYYASYVFRLPEDLTPGVYTLRVRQAEPVGGGRADGQLALTVGR